MADFLNEIKDIFQLIVDFITNMVDGIGTLVNSLQQIISIFNPSFFYNWLPGLLGIVLSTCAITLIFLRIVGR